MTQTAELFPGITLRCVRDDRFKQGCLSVQIVRPMDESEAHLNALLPAVLLRGTREHPDLRSITLRLDELYGASVGAQVRRVGDYQTTGLYCGFMEDRFAFSGDEILRPMVAFLEELLQRPALENGAFREDYVQSEKKNLISTIESELNSKQAYCAAKLMKSMCREDSFGIPRLGEKEQVAQITAAGLYAHYRRILRSSRIDLFYVGAVPMEQVADMVCPMFRGWEREYEQLPPQTAFRDAGGGEYTEEMAITQGKLSMGYVTPVTLCHEDFAAMQVFNVIFGAGMTSKLFMNIREKMSLCYSIGSGYHGSKGILTVSAGIDSHQFPVVCREVRAQLQACRDGEITPEELAAAKEAMLYSLNATHDSPGAIEGFYATAALSGLNMTAQQYMEAVHAVTAEQVVHAAQSLREHTVYFLKGVGA
jgi:predicted Zn-dependent peptidase